MLDEGGEREHLDSIEQSSHRMEEIITDLLELARASRTNVDIEPVPLGTVAGESWKSVETHGVNFDLRVPESTTIRADLARLWTVFENLFRNAREHNDTPLTVRVGVVEAATAMDGGARFEITDVELGE